MDTFEELEKRVSTLANHHQKYLHTISRFKDSLISTLESSGKMMQTHLWRSSTFPAEEMRIIAGLTDDTTTNIQHISCYYAMQFLNMNFRHLDILALEITSGGSLTDVYHQFMMNIGTHFRSLTRAYLEILFEIYLPGRSMEDFIICSVGTRADQDDIDVGIITEDGSDSEELNEALQKITQHMLVYATPLHLYLSENVGKELYTTTITEYHQLLGEQIQDVVIISELLNANKIIGGDALFNRLQEEIISRYFYSPLRDIRFHEGFLRGILGEARAQMVTPLETDTISPKHDAIRIIKAIISAKKTIHSLTQQNAWEIIEALSEEEPHLTSRYELLFKATSFLEMFKFLLQFYVTQDDQFRLEDVDKQQLALIAQKMGYRPIGAVSEWDQLIIDYYRYVNEARKLGDFLLEDIAKHLSSVSIFVRMLKAVGGIGEDSKYKGSLAKDFIENAQFFTGTKYWEDILDLLRSNEVLLGAFLDSFETMEEGERQEVISTYTEWAQYSPITIMQILTIMSKKQANIIGDSISLRMSEAFMKKLGELPSSTEKLSKIFSRYPEYIHEFLQVLTEPQFEHFYRILGKPVAEENLETYKNQLLDLCNIHEWSSQYFHRFFSRVISNHPEYLRSLTNPFQLYEIATGLLAMADAYPAYADKKQALGDYYDLEFLRVGIGSMRSVDLTTTNFEFSEFCDNYMKKLFDVCTEEVAWESSSTPPNTDTFAIIAAGGHARQEAYDDDYDLIAMVVTDDEEVIEHATRVITRMNREILKRGLLPHYRLGEMLGGFVSPLSKIVEYLSSDVDESFIDLSQMLGARMIIGSNVMKSELHEKILDRFVFSRKAYYINRMINEVCSRQEVTDKCGPELCNLKETSGGLRDIEAVMLMLKAYLSIYEPFSHDFFQKVSLNLPEISDQLDILNTSQYFLRTIRNLYRITVAAEDSINPDYLERIATILDKSNRPELNRTNAIVDQICETLDDSQSACCSIIEYLKSKLSNEF